MKKTVVSFHHEYHAKGYKLEHHMHRHRNGHIHTFIVHDHCGGLKLPTSDDLIKRYIKPNHPQWVTLDKRSEALDMHHFKHWFKGCTRKCEDKGEVCV